jgi:hypothetical protein
MCVYACVCVYVCVCVCMRVCVHVSCLCSLQTYSNAQAVRNGVHQALLSAVCVCMRVYVCVCIRLYFLHFALGWH